MRPRGAAGDGGELRLTLCVARSGRLGEGGDGDAPGGEWAEKTDGDDSCGAGERGTGGEASGELGVERVRCRGGTELLMFRRMSMPAAVPAGAGRAGRQEHEGAASARGREIKECKAEQKRA